MGLFNDSRVKQLKKDRDFLELQAANYKRLYEQACKVAAEAISELRKAKGVDPPTYVKPPRPQFDADDIERLIRLCHPDKHGNSEAANAMTKKLLSMRRA